MVKATEEVPRTADDAVPDYDNSNESACGICSHPGCPHFHGTRIRLSKQEVQAFMGWRESTLLTKHSRAAMPPSITSFPLEFDTHCIAVLKYDGVVLGRFYDREQHMKMLPVAVSERERRKAARHAKLSAAAKKRAKARRAERHGKK